MKAVDFSETIAASDLKVSRSRHIITGIIPFSCPRMFSGESCLRCRVCFVCFERWFFERVIKNIMPVYC